MWSRRTESDGMQGGKSRRVGKKVADLARRCPEDDEEVVPWSQRTMMLVDIAPAFEDDDDDDDDELQLVTSLLPVDYVISKSLDGQSLGRTRADLWNVEELQSHLATRISVLEVYLASRALYRSCHDSTAHPAQQGRTIPCRPRPPVADRASPKHPYPVRIPHSTSPVAQQCLRGGSNAPTAPDATNHRLSEQLATI
jgi:hypothetical protein